MIRNRTPAIDPAMLAIRALQFLASEPERIDRFLTLTGLSPDGLRAVAGDPSFLLSVLDHLAADEPLLLAFAAEAGLPPEQVMAAHRKLAYAGTESLDET